MEKNEVLVALEGIATKLSESPTVIYNKLREIEGVVSLSDLAAMDAEILRKECKLRRADAGKVMSEAIKILLERSGHLSLLSEDESKCLYAELLKVISECSTADFCFICDITGSMRKHIDTVKTVLNRLADTIKKTMCMNPRFAFVGFRDKGDNPQFIVQDFTRDINKLRIFLSGIVCGGGGDTCEDIKGAMQVAERLTWRSSFKHVILVCDAPPHGKSYNCGYGDKYPDDDQLKPNLEDLIKDYAIWMHMLFYKCSTAVNGLASLFEKYYSRWWNTYTEATLESGETAPETFVKVFQDSVSKSTQCGKHVIKGTYKEISPSTFALDCQSGCTMALYSVEIKSEPNFKRKKFDVEIQLARRPEKTFKISSTTEYNGAFKYCFKMQDAKDTTDQYMVKVPKISGQYETVELAKDEVESYLISRYCASEFNKTPVGKYHRIEFLQCMIGELEEGEVKKFQFAGNKYLFVERFIDGQYVKYSNNSGWVNVVQNDIDDGKVAQAFSHFTYECTLGTYLVVDLQGHKEGTTMHFTDPAVHSASFHQKFGDTNLGKVGIARFFATHVCNKFCEQLKLYPVNAILRSATKKGVEEYIKVTQELKCKRLEETLKKLREDKLIDEKFENVETGKDLDAVSDIHSTVGEDEQCDQDL